MAYELVWSAEAEDDFKKIILYLKENWSVLSAGKFVIQTYKRRENLAAMPTAARPTTLELIYCISWIVKTYCSSLWKKFFNSA